ncbi:winged helix-turn-helix transcriptional regulator [Erysipelothrix sp. HDW6C]|uniref:ArsR/SmtB family transcription factor n=1 Tax=Erysipelothrix sp. HDW6C TaxID=2714930 RepID=UPI00140A6F2D|nr:metalloregulator ArsR/SmtB family transcription factor [Erysipelothrix sp. HDW6C]QIK69442.1 winged helix-turn-helix transcriptional regulator [Erysipelothrix sp. HDW6C]
MYANADYVLMFKALADETRLNIMLMLQEESLCACHILERFAITQPTLSYHMKILVESGLVSGAKEGNWMRYTIDAEAIQMLHVLTGQLVAPVSKKGDACSVRKDL